MTDDHQRTVRASRDAMAHEAAPRRYAPLPADEAATMSVAERLILAALMLGCAAIVIRGLIAFAHDLGLLGS